MTIARRDLACRLPDDLLTEWTSQTDPYDGGFSPQLLYQDVLAILRPYESLQEFRALARLGSTYGGPKNQQQAVASGALLHNLFGTHAYLLANWIRTRNAVDAIVRLDIPRASDLSDQPTALEDVLSLALAGRVPLVVCDALEAREYDDGGYVGNDVDIPQPLISFIRTLEPLCRAGRCLVVPRATMVDSCMIGDGTVEVGRTLVDRVHDVFASSSGVLPRYPLMQPGWLLEVVIPRPIVRLMSSHSTEIVDEHAENYLMYRSVIAALCKDLTAAKREADVRHAFLQFEAGVAAVEMRYRALESDLRFKGVSVLVGMAATTLALQLPAAATVVSFLTGSATVWEGLTYIRDRRAAAAELKTSPHWFPWYKRRSEGPV